MTKNAVLYARKSTREDRQEEQSASVADQLVRNREYAERHGWTVVAECDDDGKSGLLDRSKRPGLDRALKLIEVGDADVIVTLWTSRLSRDERDRATIVDALDAMGVEWHAVDDGGRIDRSSYSGYMMYGVHTVFDVAYSKRVGENWRRAHQRRLDAGLPKSTTRQFGYTYEFDSLPSGRRTNGRYVINDAEADAVCEVYRRYARGVEGFTQIVKWLNAEGYTTSTGAPWTVRTLTRFMESGFAAGFISREADLRDLRGSHEPLITEAEWLAYRAQRDKQSARGKKASGSSEKWWLAGLVRCGLCGGSTYVDSYQRERGMVCCSNRRANPDSCKGTSILRRYVENAVGLWLGAHLEALETLLQAETGDTASVAASAYANAVQARDKIRDALGDLEVRRSLGEVEGSVYRNAQAKLTGRLKQAEDKVAEAALAVQEPTPDIGLLHGAAERGWSADERAALHGVLERVEIDSDSLTIVPIAGDPVTRSRRDLAPSCGVFGCNRVHYSRGLCKSHVMRAKNAGVFDALVEAVAADEPVTVEDVERVFAAA